jgi:hypothetical protein
MSEATQPSPITLASLLAPGVAAVRKYWRPFLLLQSAALILVVAYFANAHVRLACEQLSRFKQHSELVFSMITAAIAGALLPELAKAIMLNERVIDRQRMRDVGFAMVIFAGAGVIANYQYQFFAWIFGHDNHASTIIRKMLFDQFITTPIYGVPYYLILYLLRTNRYHVLKTASEITPRWYVTCALPLLIPCWCYWIPMVSLIYTLPGPLQFCLYCFALAAWSLLMVFVATHEAKRAKKEN